MSLYWPINESVIDVGMPRLHALVVGVDDYDHMGIGAQSPSAILSGLNPLTTATPTALRVADWLERDYRNNDCPLGSIEILLSPKKILSRKDGPKISVEKSSMENIRRAFVRWYNRCNVDSGSIAFFYFVGHGISTLDQFLLPADFGDPSRPNSWENCIDFNGMKLGMGKCLAQNQFFFIDACRDAPVSALVERRPRGDPLVSSSYYSFANVSAAYYAASEGRQAHGRDGEETYFCKALLMCLGGVAGSKSGPVWQVDAASISNALVRVIKILADCHNLPLSCECLIQRPAPLHYPGRGSVLVKIHCSPIEASQESAIVIEQGAESIRSPSGSKDRPWVGRVRDGNARIEVSFINFRSKIVEECMIPPAFELEIDR